MMTLFERGARATNQVGQSTLSVYVDHSSLRIPSLPLEYQRPTLLSMFGGAANPYDEIISESLLDAAAPGRWHLADAFTVKATDENLASEDWALNLEVCDKVSGDGTTGYAQLPCACICESREADVEYRARNAVAALQKRLSHRNPNVQLYALEVSCQLPAPPRRR